MKYDVAIVGGGIVGLALACRLALQQPLSILILEAKEMPDVYAVGDDFDRVSALNLASQRFLQEMGVWQRLNVNRVCAYKHMQVWDDLHQGKINFDHEALNVAALGYIVENAALQQALLAQIKQCPRIHLMTSLQLTEVSVTDDVVTLTTHDQTQWQALLAIGADGAQSQLRQLADIAIEKKDYNEHAIVATVTCEYPLKQTAYQVFLPDGPLAFLPLASTDKALASLVWSLSTPVAETIMQLDDLAFNAKLTHAFTQKLGKVLHSTHRQCFPLFLQQAKHYVKPRLALLGDAAHVVHPLAGQGLNMGLADAADLYAVLHKVMDKGGDVAAYNHLRRFERSAKARHAAWMVGIDGIHALFAAKHPFWQHGRSMGLHLAHHFTPLKRFFMRQALGY